MSTATVSGGTVFGNLKVKYGTIAGSGTSGTLTTGLYKIFFYHIQSTANATPFWGSISGGDISYTMSSADTAYWIAIGL